MTMGYGNYEELLATYAEWLNWLREKKTNLLAQKARLEVGKRKQDGATLPIALSGSENYARLAGLDGTVTAPSPAKPLPMPDEPAKPPDEEQPVFETAGASDEESIVPMVAVLPPVPMVQQDDQDELA